MSARIYTLVQRVRDVAEALAPMRGFYIASGEIAEGTDAGISATLLVDELLEIARTLEQERTEVVTLREQIENFAEDWKANFEQYEKHIQELERAVIELWNERVAYQALFEAVDNKSIKLQDINPKVFDAYYKLTATPEPSKEIFDLIAKLSTSNPGER